VKYHKNFLLFTGRPFTGDQYHIRQCRFLIVNVFNVDAGIAGNLAPGQFLLTLVWKNQAQNYLMAEGYFNRTLIITIESR
jgi:hypothetical protein